MMTPTIRPTNIDIQNLFHFTNTEKHKDNDNTKFSNYNLIDFIFRTDINANFSDYDIHEKVYYNNPIFLNFCSLQCLADYKI